MKPFSLATALDSGRFTPQSTVNTGPGKFNIGNRTIHDSHANGMLTLEEVLAKSSNIGTSKIALQLPAQLLWNTYTNVGFGLPPRIGLPGAVAGGCGLTRSGSRSSRRRSRTATAFRCRCCSWRALTRSSRAMVMWCR